jgi:hypothetical protein
MMGEQLGRQDRLFHEFCLRPKYLTVTANARGRE